MTNDYGDITFEGTSAIPPDGGMINLLMAGDEEAFKIYYDGFYPAVRNFTMKMVRLLTVAEEIANNSFVKYWATRTTVRSLEEAKAYIYRVARNESINWLGKRSTEFKTQESYSIYIQQVPEEIINEEMHAELLAAIEKRVEYLPTKQKLAFRMYFVEQLKVAEIADILDISESAVRTHLTRAIDSIKEHIQGRQNFVSSVVMTAIVLYYLLLNILNFLKKS